MINRLPFVVGFLVVFLAFAAARAEPRLAHVDVFTSGTEGYHTFRIPAIETAPDGTLVALAEARRYNRSDPGHNENDIDLVYKRSTDNGRSWSALNVLDDPGERWSACNPVAVADRDTGRLWVLHARTKPGCSSSTSRPGTDDAQTWTRCSDDSGKTWSDAVDITAVARDVQNWGGSFFGPGGAIQDSRGRLIVPLSKTTGRRDADGRLRGGPWNAFVIYSDDHGRSWHRGQLLPGGDWGNENQLVELADGRILMDVRQMSGTHRWLVTSRDCGQSWSTPRAGQTVPPVACAIQRYTLESSGDDRDRILWCGPKGPGRKTLVVRTSYDEGATFTNERVISDEDAAYSDMTVLNDKTVGVLWERADYRYLCFSRFNLEFLESTRGSP